MKQVAIVHGQNVDAYEFDDYTRRFIAHSITDWTEVSDEDYELLRRGLSTSSRNQFVLIERVEDEQQFVERTVQAYVARVRREEAARAKYKAESDRLARERKVKREERALEKKRKQLEQLKAELGEQ